MLARLSQALCIVTLAASAPAYAEVWDCTFTTVPDAVHTTSTSGSVKFQVDGNILTFQFPGPMDAIARRDYLAGMFRYQVLEDNDLGLVAVNARSGAIGQSEPVIGATIVTINKSNGELHIGSVTQTGVYDQEHGRCELNPATP